MPQSAASAPLQPLGGVGFDDAVPGVAGIVGHDRHHVPALWVLSPKVQAIGENRARAALPVCPSAIPMDQAQLVVTITPEPEELVGGVPVAE